MKSKACIATLLYIALAMCSCAFFVSKEGTAKQDIVSIEDSSLDLDKSLIPTVPSETVQPPVPPSEPAPAVVDGIRQYDYFPSDSENQGNTPSSVLILWERPEEPFDFVHLTVSYPPSTESKEKIRLSLIELEEVEHPVHGSLLGYRLPDVNPGSEILVSVQIEKDGTLSEASETVHLPPYIEVLDYPGEE